MAAAETVHAPEFEETSSSLFSCSAWLSCAGVALSKDPLWRVAGSSAALDADPGFNMAACRSRSKSGAFTVLALVFFVFSGPCAEAFQPSVPRKFQQSLEELDPDFGGELDSAGVSAYLNVLPAEAGRDRNVMRTAKPKRVPVRPQGKLEWVTLRATARKFVKETNLELAKTQYETILQTKISGLPARTVASLHIELGNVYVKLGDEGAARYHFQEAQAFVPQHALPHIRMAQLDTQLGRFDEAVEHYKHALFFNNSHTLAAQLGKSSLHSV